ncbi:MAG: FAD-dependent oxidoreductase [Methermicoccaceae archaeon]
MDKVGAVAVLGGGVGGIQASLDLAESGFKVYLIESDVSIGGVMAALDKTFPTNDCAICILSPKLVEAARHPNIELYSFSEIVDMTGEPGAYKLKVVHKARYVDEDKCTGCGLCTEKCPVKVDSEFDEGIIKRKAIYYPFPQAVPRVARIDADHCLMLTKGKCGVCAKVCDANAVNFDDVDREEILEVGSVIIATGFKAFDPSGMSQYHPEHPDVITSMQFERLLNASGPTAGHVVRLSDGREPKKIGFIQCIGSRSKTDGKPYCSSVCCAYATKEAMIAIDHDKELEVTIFNIDMRVFGKGFEEFYERAKTQYGIRYIDSRPSGVIVKDDGSLSVRYENHNTGESEEMDLDMVVLSVGLEASPKIYKVADALGVELDEYGIVKTSIEAPVSASREGVYVLGAAQGPKDIPDTVAQASGAAAKAHALLSEARGTRVEAPNLPPEKDVSGEPPRVGVFVCHCGLNIGGVLDVPAVAEYAATLPHVVFAKDNKYSCSSDTQEIIKDAIQRYNLNRVIVAACTPRTHEPLFQGTIREAGLNPYLFEFVNIREHISWVNKNEPEKATEKAKEMVRMGVAKAVRLKPLYKDKLPLTHSALVIGGGISGMAAALDIADMGFPVYLIERESELGGNLRNLTKLMDGRHPSEVYQPLIDRVMAHENITVYTSSTLTEMQGFIGNYEGKIKTADGELDIKFGAAVVATGAVELKPDGYFKYSVYDNVITQQELEQKLEDGLDAKRVVMIQCAGSRVPERTYCSRICCMVAVTNAIRIKEEDPSKEVYILYRDIRTYGMLEKYYDRARELGVVFIKYTPDKPPMVEEDRVVVHDRLLNDTIDIPYDLVVLSAPLVPPEGVEDTSILFKVPIDVVSGFFFEAHVKLRPVEFATPGVFLCGTAQGPRNIPESLSQASGAASKVGALLAKEFIEAESDVSVVNEDVCIGCGVCVPMCPYTAISMVEREVEVDGKKLVVQKSSINPAACAGCGTCTAACNPGAIEQRHFENPQLLAQVKAAFSLKQGGEN